jgi:hypothetical protein
VREKREMSPTPSHEAANWTVSDREAVYLRTYGLWLSILSFQVPSTFHSNALIKSIEQEALEFKD